jgi:hypothetical protein
MASHHHPAEHLLLASLLPALGLIKGSPKLSASYLAQPLLYVPSSPLSINLHMEEAAG